MSDQSEPKYTSPDYASLSSNRFFSLTSGEKQAVQFAAEKLLAAARAAGDKVPPIATVRQELATGNVDQMLEEYKRACEAGDERALLVQKKFTLPQGG